MFNGSQRSELVQWIIGITTVATLGFMAFAFLHPMYEEEGIKSHATERYLDALVGDEGSIDEAGGWAAEGSQAHHFAETLGVAWRALVDSGTAFTSDGDGTVTPLESGAYEVCLPKLDVFGDHCPEFANFEFTELNRLARFTVDSQPVEQVFKFRNYEMPLTDDEGSHQMRAVSAGGVSDRASDEKIVLLWIDRSSPVSTQGRDDLAFSSVTAHDGRGQEIPVIAEYFPATFSYLDKYFAAVRVPDAARNLYVCWNGAPEGEEACDWVVARG